MWLTDAKKAGLCFYVSKETIGKVSFAVSSWYTGRDERFFYGKGAYYQAVHPKTKFLWMLYFAYRAKGNTKLTYSERIQWMRQGMRGYELGKSYVEYTNEAKPS